MSTDFQPIEIPPGVVSMATKKQKSSNWSEVNCMRWREGQLMPIGGQVRYNYAIPFASRCKLIHSWYGIDGISRTAYLCEQHLYVDQGGQLFDISPTPPIAPPHTVTTGGYNDGPYNEGAYNTARTISTSIAITRIPNAYSLDNFGSILYAMCSADGRLLKWDPASGTGTAATEQVADSGRGPVPRGRCFVVTAERFLMIFSTQADGTVGGGSARRFAWCDQENPGAWDYTNVTSQAGYLDVEPASPIIAAKSSRTGIIFWTGKKAYRSRFLGLPYIYNYEELGDGTTPWSPQSVASTMNMILWMSDQGMFSFDGTSMVPVPCMVRPWIDDDIDPVWVREEAFATHVADFNEVWWFFPQLGQNVQFPKPTRAAFYNYKEGWWSQAQMSRTAGITAAYNSHTVMADDTVAYEHENDIAFPSGPLPWAETFDLNVSNAGRLVTVKQMMPDIEGVGSKTDAQIQAAISAIRYSLFYRNSRSLGAPELQTDLKSVRPNGYVDFRVTGRDLRLRIDMAGPGAPLFTVGQHLFDIAIRGDR